MAAKMAAARERMSPVRLFPPEETSARAMIRLPTMVIKILNHAFEEMEPPRNIRKPNATQITYVHTIAVELATDV